MPPISEVYARSRGALFRLRIEPGPEVGQWSWGTGFFISPEGYALTAYHNLPSDVANNRSGVLTGALRDGREVQFTYIPTSRDREEDIALLRAPPEGGNYLCLTPAALRPGADDVERTRFWAGRPVLVAGFPFTEKGQDEALIAGHARADMPFGLQDEKENDQALVQITRLKIVPDRCWGLPGISGGPVIDLVSGTAVGVEGACHEGERLILASELRRNGSRWPPAVEHSFRQLKPDQRLWLVVAVTLVCAMLGSFLVLMLANLMVWLNAKGAAGTGPNVLWPVLGILASVLGGALWNLLCKRLGWPYHMGGSGNEPHGLRAFIWGAVTTWPIPVCAFLASPGAAPALLSPDGLGVVAAYALFAGVGALVFYDLRLREWVESRRMRYGRQELAIVTLWSAALSCSITLGTVVFWSVARAPLHLGPLFLQVPFCVAFSVLSVFAFLTVARPVPAFDQARGLLAGFAVRLGLFFGFLLSVG